MDIVSKRTRSKMMSGIKGSNTKPEIQVRKYLHGAGFRFRLHARELPGRPDIVLPRHGAVVQVQGCFWHGHPGCPFATSPATRPEFWAAKIAANAARDFRTNSELISNGWRLAIVWECALRKTFEPAMLELVAFLRSQDLKVEIGMSGVYQEPRNE